MSELAVPAVEGLSEVPAPSLLFDVEAISRNIERMIEIAGGSPELLRPHMKTHKCGEILRMQVERGITKAKCATIAEAELAAQSGVSEALVSYPLVGANAARLGKLTQLYPETTFSAIADSDRGIQDLAACASPDQPLDIFLDLDCGMHRTGIGATDAALVLVRAIKRNDSLRFAGIHAYDGHIHDASIEARREAFNLAMEVLDELLARIEGEGIEVPLIVSGGTPTFAFHAEKAKSADRPWQCSPGTTLLWDAGYGTHYPDLAFDPAAFLLTRVVSHPGENTICVDLGNKAVSAENPIENRVRFPGLPVVRFVGQSEEHLVIEVTDRTQLPVGTELLGMPYHICPTVALYQRARLLRDGAVTDEEWEIEARDRRVTV